jgi:hypothetical protein
MGPTYKSNQVVLNFYKVVSMIFKFRLQVSLSANVGLRPGELVSLSLFLSLSMLMLLSVTCVGSISEALKCGL